MQIVTLNLNVTGLTRNTNNSVTKKAVIQVQAVIKLVSSVYLITGYTKCYKQRQIRL